MNGELSKRESSIWARAYERSLAHGDDHGWAANAGDNAVERERTKRRKVKAGESR